MLDCKGCSETNAAERSHVAIKDIAREPTARIMVTLTVVAESSRVDGGCAYTHTLCMCACAHVPARQTLLFVTFAILRF